jgi:hypothetical protein
MPSYAAFVGHLPAISKAEISAAFPDVTFRRMVGKQVLLFETSADIGQKDLDRLGGTVLLAKRITDAGVSLGDVPKILAGELEGTKGKATFGLRTVGVHPPRVKNMYRDGKDLLKKKGKPSRYVGNERMPAATALLHDGGLLDPKSGCELVILEDSENKFLWIGRTVAAQNPSAYTKRDMEKPVRDTRVGLLPPKLAQILLAFGTWLLQEKNGGKIPKHITMFDPFCGTGVIPMEALLLGYEVLASDSSLKAVNGCEKNLDWMRKHFDIKKKDVPSSVWKQDALKPFDLKTLPDIIVSETTLGPPLTDRPNVKEANSLRAAADLLQLNFLKNAAATLPGVPLALTWPAWYLKTGVVTLERTWKALENLPYKAVLPPGSEPESAERPTLIYRRPETVVGREIVLLLPK